MPFVRSLRWPSLFLPFLGVAALIGCGDTGGTGPLKVTSGTSLKSAISEIAGAYPGGPVQLEFAGSDAAATAIRAGRKPDVFLAASLKIPSQLASEGLTEAPVVFARNRVVVAVSSKNSAIISIEDLAKTGVTVAIGSPSVPIGAYADKILAALPPATQARVRANIRSREPDAASVSAKVRSGTVQAAILYETDVKASKGELKAIQIPVALGSMTECAAVVVKGTGREATSAKFIAALVAPSAQKILVNHGFLPAQAK